MHRMLPMYPRAPPGESSPSRADSLKVDPPERKLVHPVDNSRVHVLLVYVCVLSYSYARMSGRLRLTTRICVCTEILVRPYVLTIETDYSYMCVYWNTGTPECPDDCDWLLVYVCVLKYWYARMSGRLRCFTRVQKVCHHVGTIQPSL